MINMTKTKLENPRAYFIGYTVPYTPGIMHTM